MSLREQRVQLLFPTRLATAILDEPALCDAVLAEVLARSETHPNVGRGEVTGWQSGNDLHTWSANSAALANQLAQAVYGLSEQPPAELDLFAWANVLRAGDYFTPHTHANAAWSGVLYLAIGDESGGGELCMRDPRAGAAMVITESNHADSACTLRHAPRTHELVIFPAWLVHWVAPYRGTTPRVSIAFNAR